MHRILFINTLYKPYIGGGAELTLHNVATSLQARGHSVAVLTTCNKSGTNLDLIDGVQVYRAGIHNIYWQYPPREDAGWKRAIWHALDIYNPLAARDVVKVIKEFKPDIVSTQNLSGLSVSAWTACKRMGVPIVQVLHDYYSVCPKVTMFNGETNCVKRCSSCKLYRLPHNSLSRNVHTVVGVSQFVLNTHLNVGLFADAQYKRVIYNANNFPPAQGEKDPGFFTFGYIGALTPVKGIESLIKAFIKLSSTSSQKLRLLVAGKGKDEYVAHLKQLAKAANIEFIGYVKPESFYPQLDVSVVSSIWNEPFAGVVYEPLGYGIPVIGANRGGIPEVIRHENNGLIYDPDNNIALQNAMQKCIDEPSLMESMRKSAKDSVAHLLNQDRMIDEYEQLFLQVANTSK
jgi:glycosyltransferase involved in cell wall biosynthesis